MRNNFTVIRVVILIVLIAVFLPSCDRESPWGDSEITSRTGLSELPLTFPVQTKEIAIYFNQIASPEDIAAFPYAHSLLLPHVTTGKKMVVFPSWADTERKLDALIDQIDIIGYNSEHWQNTPDYEKADIPGTVQRAAEFAHAYGLQFMFGPDRIFAVEHIGEVAPYVDFVLLQGQRLQDDPQAFSDWMHDMISVIRASNPRVQIFVQVGATRGSASLMYTAIQSVSNDADGIAIWSMPKSLEVLQEFVALIRENLTGR